MKISPKMCHNLYISYIHSGTLYTWCVSSCHAQCVNILLPIRSALRSSYSLIREATVILNSPRLRKIRSHFPPPQRVACGGFVRLVYVFDAAIIGHAAMLSGRYYRC